MRSPGVIISCWPIRVSKSYQMVEVNAWIRENFYFFFPYHSMVNFQGIQFSKPICPEQMILPHVLFCVVALWLQTFQVWNAHCGCSDVLYGLHTEPWSVGGHPNWWWFEISCESGGVSFLSTKFFEGLHGMWRYVPLLIGMKVATQHSDWQHLAKKHLKTAIMTLPAFWSTKIYISFHLIPMRSFLDLRRP